MKLNEIFKIYLNSSFIPSSVVVVWIAMLMGGIFRNKYFGHFSLLYPFALLGTLIAGIYQIVKSKWIKAIINVVSFISFSYITYLIVVYSA